MKKLIAIIAILIPLTLSGTGYYVSQDGSDADTGLSDAAAWQSIEKVNTEWSAGTFAPGDSIYFRKGDTFYGTIIIAEGGTSGNDIVIAAYGTGAKPIITGFTTLTSWSVYSGSIYRAAISSSEAQTNMVAVDGIPVGMGRYPDAGTWLTYTTATSTSITDPEMTSSPDWDGAELAVNVNDWSLERKLITNHTGTLFVYTNIGGSQTPYANRNYFIQNDLRCVTTTNEWYHDYSGGYLYIYGNPSAKEVKVATLNYLISNGSYDYITITGIDFEGSISHALNFTSSSDHLTIKDCEIRYAGRVAIRTYGSETVNIEDNEIEYCHETGCYMVGGYFTITGNHISNIGMIAGGALIAHPSGIFLNNTNNTVSYNTIEYTGWSGINTTSIATFTISYNFINYPMQVLDDGGGIYYTSSQGTRLVDHNIVLNSGVGAPADVAIARGIYLDAYSSGSTVSNNIVANCREAGYQIHAGTYNTLTGNLSYNNGMQVLFQKIATSSTNTAFNHNKLICKEATQYAFMSYSYSSSELQALGTFDYNYYARPIDDDYVFYYSGSHTLTDWKALVTPDDVHSYGSPVTVISETEYHFIYNETEVSKYYELSSTLVDVEGTEYSGTIELPSWTALVLLGSGTITEAGGGEEEGGEGDFLIDADGNFLKTTTEELLING